MHKQRGFTFWSLLFTVGGVVIAAVLVMKLFPPYSEYFAVKKAINKLASSGSLDAMSTEEIRRSFERTSDIEYNITHIKPGDLKIRRSNDGAKVVTAEYEVVVPLVANISFLLQFRASTDDAGAASLMK